MKVLGGAPLSRQEAISLYRFAGDGELMEAAHKVRMIKNPSNLVGWIIDRNVNITNVCVSFCTFCNFCRREGDEGAYITTPEQYREKISQLFALGGNQLLLQGGMHPRLGLKFYTDLFRTLKSGFPTLRLHALGPPEIVHLARLEKTGFKEVLEAMHQAGMDSLPGAGAEILVDRVRTKVSKVKCSADDWLEVMRIAHKMNLPTSATMMFGHIETMEERIEHLFRIRDVQDQKPEGNHGFINFVPWPFMDDGTILREKLGVRSQIDSRAYIRLLAVSRLVLHNIQHIQASWLTVGVTAGQICLHAGADDFGSIMIEENVVSAAGAQHQMDTAGIQAAIVEAGFTPYKRNQLFEAAD